MIPAWEKAADFILANLHSNGGVPAVLPNDPIGCWTTAEVLDFLLDEHHLAVGSLRKIRQLVSFLVASQDHHGGWPLTLGGEHGSTMSTGHALSALCKAKAKEGLVTKTRQVTSAIEKAEAWLIKKQNMDGGWGVEPDLAEGSSSRMIATYYAVHGLYRASSGRSERSLMLAKSYIDGAKNKDGAWGYANGQRSDVGNTARALLTLSRIGEDVTRNRAWDFVIRHDDQWRMDVESYVAKATTGHVIFHSNTLVDVGNALMASGFSDHFDTLSRVYSHIAEKQNDDGSWHLVDWERTDKNVIMWCTSEYARFMANFAYRLSVELCGDPHFVNKTSETIEPILEKKGLGRFFSGKNLVILCLALALVQSHFDLVGFVFDLLIGTLSVLKAAPDTIVEWWGKQSTRTHWVLGVLGALALSIVANFFTSIIQSVSGGLRKIFGRKHEDTNED